MSNKYLVKVHANEKWEGEPCQTVMSAANIKIFLFEQSIPTFVRKNEIIRLQILPIT